MRRLLASLALGLLTHAHAAEFSVIRTYTYPIIIQRPVTAEGKLIVVSGGTGITLQPDYVITAQHVLPKAPHDRISFAVGGKLMTGEVVKADEAVDLALVRVPGVKCPCAELITGTELVDQDAWIVGYPMFLVYGTQFVTTGQIQGRHNGKIVATPNTAPGGSGGGLFIKQNGQYKLAGIVVQIAATPQGPPQLNVSQEHTWMTFSVPIETINKFLKGTPVSK